MLRIVLVGAAGRMGKAVEEAAAAADDLRIVARVDRLAGAAASGPRAGAGAGSGAAGGAPGAAPALVEELSSVLAAGDVVIEFSSPEGTRRAAAACAEKGAALVSGTTALGPEDEAAVRAASARVAVLRAANLSLGLGALRQALAAALAALPGRWDVEIVERHHRAKVDSPSGTALQLARQVAAHRGLPPEALRAGRQGRVGPRPEGEVGIHAVRGGSWVGDHAVMLAGDGEWLELRHVAESRSAFAHGALAAARFVATAPPGLYTVEDITLPQGRV